MGNTIFNKSGVNEEGFFLVLETLSIPTTSLLEVNGNDFTLKTNIKMSSAPKNNAQLFVDSEVLAVYNLMAGVFNYEISFGFKGDDLVVNFKYTSEEQNRIYFVQKLLRELGGEKGIERLFAAASIRA